MYIVRSKKKKQLYYSFKKMHHYLPNTTIHVFAKCCEWLADSLTCWLNYWLIMWLTEWLTGWHVNWLTCLPTYCSIDGLTGSILLIGCFTDKLINIIDWQSQTDRLSMTTGSLTNWLDWLADILRFMLWKESRLLIANEDGEFFISDQMCPADVLRLQQPRFWAYLQYCKCCIHCLVNYS